MIPKTVLAAASKLCILPARQNAAVRAGQARFGTSSVNGVAYRPVPKPLQDKMKLFQIANGLPVHLKGGTTDKFLYVITSVVCGIGLFDCFRVYYVLAYGPTKQD